MITPTELRLDIWFGVRWIWALQMYQNWTKFRKFICDSKHSSSFGKQSDIININHHIFQQQNHFPIDRENIKRIGYTTARSILYSLNEYRQNSSSTDMNGRIVLLHTVCRNNFNHQLIRRRCRQKLFYINVSGKSINFYYLIDHVNSFIDT